MDHVIGCEEVRIFIDMNFRGAIDKYNKMKRRK